MEGLIPFVIHAIKKSRRRSRYRCLSSRSQGEGNRKPLADWGMDDGSSHHRRTRSEFPAVGSDYFSSDPPRIGPSRSLRDDAIRSFAPTGEAHVRK